MTDDMIRSMKQQMTPSDDVVADLLAKIAALEASPETDNVVSFDESRFTRTTEFTEKSADKAKKSTTKKSIWFYGTAAAASALVLLSTFAMFGGDADVQDQFDEIVNNPGIVIDGVGVGENTPDPVYPVVTPDDKDDNNDEDIQTPPVDGRIGTDENDNSGNNDAESGDTSDNPVTPDNSGDKTPDNNSESKTPDNSSAPSDGDSSDKSGKNEDPGKSSVTAPPPVGGDEDPQGGSVEADNSKVTPGAAGTSDISWKREILAESSVSNITVSGTNYVVESVASSPSVASTEVQKISLEIPATSTTNQTTVAAKVKKVKNVSENLMVAVDAEGFKETLLYTNMDYSPSSLGQFIEDSGLGRDNTSFAKAVYCKGEQIGYSSYQRKNIDGIKGLAEQCILCNYDAPLGSYSAYNSGNVHVLFKSSKNPTQAVIDFGVSDNGYLYVKMASGKAFTFHIGTEMANSFISQITGM